VGIPFEVSPKGMEYHDVTGGEVLRLIHVEEHTGNHAGYCMKKTV